MTSNLKSLLPDIIELTRAAGNAILECMGDKEALDVKRKSDNTPLTVADLQSHSIIAKGLKQITPDIPILSEEGDIPDYMVRREWKQYWLIDPLDGTRGFVDNSDEFTVNIALIDNHESVLGVVFAPAKDICFWAYQNGGAFQQQGNHHPEPIKTRDFDWSDLTVLVGKYHGMKRLSLLEEKLQKITLLKCNSSLKLCLIASGTGDLYPRFGPISEWDTGAAHCILKEAGGIIVDFTGKELQYNAQSSLLCPEFVALGDISQQGKLLDVFESIRREL